jgi:hypothetical protein
MVRILENCLRNDLRRLSFEITRQTHYASEIAALYLV